MILKDDNLHSAAVASRKPAKGMRATASYSSMKALTTLKGVHRAVHEWSARHPYDSTKTSCAYCSQFNSLVALQLRRSRGRVEQNVNKPTADETATLSVVVKNSTLRQFEDCLNNYITGARAVRRSSARATARASRTFRP